MFTEFLFVKQFILFMTFMNPLNLNDFNVNVILLFSRINDDFQIHNLNLNMILKESKNTIFSPSGFRTYIEFPIKWKDF